MPRRHRILLTVVALLGAVAAVMAVSGGRFWLVGGNVEIGPVASTSCFAGDCQRGGLSWIGAEALWLRAGIATYAAGFLLAFVTVALAALLAAGKAGPLISKLVLVTAVTQLVVATVFVVQRPELPGAAAGRGLYLLGAGLLLSAAAAIFTLRARRE